MPKQRPSSNPDLMTTAEAAAYLGLGKNTMEQWRCAKKQGQPKYLTIGRNVRYRKSDLDRWLERNAVEHR